MNLAMNTNFYETILITLFGFYKHLMTFYTQKYLYPNGGDGWHDLDLKGGGFSLSPI